MALDRPFRRIVRPGQGGSYSRSGLSAYIKHPAYAPGARAQVRAHLLLEQDLRALFDYLEPADENLAAFSMRNHALIVRACNHVEANARVILRENGWAPDKSAKPRESWNIEAFHRLESSHHLSAYEVLMPDWHGTRGIRRPFAAWSGAYTPTAWWKAYNGIKHDSAANFREARFEHVVDSVCACLVLITAQFLDEDFSGAPGAMLLSSADDDGLESTAGGYLRVKLPADFSEDECYEFDPRTFADESDPFDRFDFTKV